MRGVMFALAGGASIILAAGSANAQYYGQRYGYGYNSGYAEASILEQRIYNVLRSLDGVAPYQQEQLRGEAINLDRQLRYATRNGLTPYESRNFDVRIGELERHQIWASRGSGYNRYYQIEGHGHGHHHDDDDD